MGGQAEQIRTTDFNITQGQSKALFQNGVTAARDFLATWDFDKWKKEYRHNTKGQPVPATEATHLD